VWGGGGVISWLKPLIKPRIVGHLGQNPRVKGCKRVCVCSSDGALGVPGRFKKKEEIVWWDRANPVQKGGELKESK